MLYVYYGNNQNEVRKRALARAGACVSPGKEVVRLTGEEYYDGMLTELAGGNPLFGGTEVFLLDTPSEKTGYYDAVIEALPILKESPHTFVLVEITFSAGEKKECVKYGEVCEEVVVEKEKLNVFALSDALADKNKKELWLILTRLTQEGVPHEEIIGILFWQLKMLRLAERTESAEEAGLKPFVYGKAKRALVKFKSGDIERISRSLLQLYHDGHVGKRDLGLALEHWVLSI